MLVTAEAYPEAEADHNPGMGDPPMRGSLASLVMAVLSSSVSENMEYMSSWLRAKEG